MRARFNPFIAMVSLTAGTAFFYLGTQLVGPVSQPFVVKLALWASLAVPFLLVLWLPFVYWRRDDAGSAPRRDEIILWGSYLSMGVLSFLLVLVALRDLFLLASAVLSVRTLPLSLLDGRGSALILALAACAIALGLFQARRAPSVTRVDIPVPGLPEGLDGFTIAQISDLHVGSMIRREFVEGVVRTVNALGPDLIALTGDLADGMPDELRKDFAPLGALRAREGTYYVTGNHEYYWDAPLWISEVKSLGHQPLLNEGRMIRRSGATLFIAGVTDHWNGADPQAASQGAANADFRILLAHQPKTAEAAALAGFDLQLSGHTHGGQFIPWTWVVGFLQPFTRGLHKLGRMWIYVNRGTGYWGPPLRLGAPSEITLLRLKSQL